MNDGMKEVLRKKDFAVYEGTTENISWHGYGFKIENVEKMAPILANGKLGLWEYEV